MQNPFYITTTLPYVNADPHIGFALEIIQADALARHQRLLGNEVFFNTGTDEHGQKIFQKAIEENKDPQTYCNEYAAKFDRLKSALNLSYNAFIRTTDSHHIKAAQSFWTLCWQNGDIYKKLYKVKYCVGCELEKTDSELVEGKCPLHPAKELELREEENYFFRFSRYQQALLDLYQKYPDFVIPNWRLNEISNFVAKGLQDFSISRLKAKMPWGIPVPNDPEHVMYVWFDALINYISTLNWPDDNEKFEKFWGTKDNPKALQVAGKDNLRQQSAMWQAMLLSAGLPTSRHILIHGFITANGQKMSKSIGNVVDPFVLVEKYGTDAARYYLLKEMNPFEDGDFSEKRFIEIYNSDLANGLGNLISRVITLTHKFTDGKVPYIKTDPELHPLRISEEMYTWKMAYSDIDKAMPKFLFHEALNAIQKFISQADKYINDQRPWELIKTDKEKFNYVLYGLLDSLHQLAWMIYPFLPQTSIKLARVLGLEKLLLDSPNSNDSYVNIKQGSDIKTIQPLFPRIQLSKP